MCRLKDLVVSYEHDLSIWGNMRSRCFIRHRRRFRYGMENVFVRERKDAKVSQIVRYLLLRMNWCPTWYFWASCFFHDTLSLVSGAFDSHRQLHRSRPTHLGNNYCTTNLISSKVTFITFWKKKREIIVVMNCGLLLLRAQVEWKPSCRSLHKYFIKKP